MMTFLVRYRRPVIVAVQLLLIVASNYFAFWLRFDGDIPTREFTLWITTLPWLLLVRGTVFIPFRLYEGFWRYAGVWDLRNILAGVLTSSVLFFLFVYEGLAIQGYPRSIFLLDALLLVCFLGGVRVLPRFYRELKRGNGGKRVLIYGAGDAGEMLVRDMKRHSAAYAPVGFIDDSPNKQGLRIHGVPVLGAREQLDTIMTRYKPDEVLVAIPAAPPRTIRQIVQALEPFKTPIKTLPSLHEILDGKATVDLIRDLALEDLLSRPTVQLDLEPVRRFVTGKRVLVTGAGGSIGAELCRQLSRYEPEALVLADKAESALYDVEMELAQWLPAYRRVAFLVDITHVSRLHEVFVQYAPQVVFHAAAYKHVPMLEAYPAEGVLNNIGGTRCLCQAAVQHSVETFVLISSDKAVNPTNIMGATKRVCELYVQSLARSTTHGRTVFCAVRFGNVLGSNGSVVPLFLKQIKAGGSVTVTHPEVARYFMTIPEAVQLVLQAAPLAKGGDIFVLDMGEQIKVLDLAHHLIRLAGFVPSKDIPITFTGLRPGEKLYEELIDRDEAVEACGVTKIQRVQPLWLPELTAFSGQLDELERLAEQGEGEALRAALRKAAPTFRPAEPQRTNGFASPSDPDAQAQKDFVALAK
jgi:FlaA1/EpsC-like NDP-sugar epimerase